MNPRISRRDSLAGLGFAAAAASLAHRVAAEDAAAGPALKGRVRHSVCKWCYGGVPLEKLAEFSKSIGLQSIELLSGNAGLFHEKVGQTMIVEKL